tara:strand:+ start:443 stop:1012 length:570 start_codon:yes stop_codon:yes gene_type:complete
MSSYTNDSGNPRTIIKNKTYGKGMTMSLKVVKDETGHHLRMHNSYFGGTVFQDYTNKIDTTTIRIQMNMMYSPKWLTAKLGGIGTNNQAHLVIKEKGLTIMFTGYSGQLHNTTEKKGIAFQGNIENISSLRMYKERLNKARDIIKHNSYDDLISCAIKSENKNDITPFSTAYEHFLDPNKFYRLNGSKD